ncbi:hypothetical protein DIPPA_24353 [Diplonema papillatum]|nr:hypothetical protein DIPPA_24353 [Diplonema papillatum]
MNRPIIFLCLCAVACAAACGSGGQLVGDCCVCRKGWAKGATGDCTECAPGFYGSESGFCTNSQNGSACYDGYPAPMGCGAGFCTQVTINGQVAKVFPCNCGNSQMTESTFCQYPSTCLPHGPSLYTTFPNRPVTNEPFNLLVVGCSLDKDDAYLIIPARKNGRDNTCEEMDLNKMHPECRFNGTEATPSAGCAAGIAIEGVLKTHVDVNRGSTTRTAAVGITFPDAFLVDGPDFLVCHESTRTTRTGVVEAVWRPLDGHDEYVSKRDHHFTVDTVRNAYSGAAAGEGDERCCEGLKIGSFCLPLWLFILLWVLMALCMGAVGFQMVQHKRDIDDWQYNKKFEAFEMCESTELMKTAGQRDESDSLCV